MSSQYIWDIDHTRKVRTSTIKQFHISAGGYKTTADKQWMVSGYISEMDTVLISIHATQADAILEVNSITEGK
jgi:hypothetical protein